MLATSSTLAAMRRGTRHSADGPRLAALVRLASRAQEEKMVRRHGPNLISSRSKAAAAPRFQPRDPRPFSGSASHAAGSAGYSLRDWQGWSVPRSPMRSPWLPRRTAARSDENTIADRGTRYPAEPGSAG